MNPHLSKALSTFAAVSVAVLAVTAISAGVAAAAPPTTAHPSVVSSPEYCAILVSGFDTDAEGNSLLLAESCGSSPAAAAEGMAAEAASHLTTEARAGLTSPSASASASASATASNTHLATYYEGYNYLGVSTTVYGNAGGCDDSGYNLSGGSFKNLMSSMRGYNNCNYAEMRSNSSPVTSANRCLDMPYAPVGIDDNFGGMQLRYVSSCG